MPFYEGKLRSARFYADQVLPRVQGLARVVQSGAASVSGADAALLGEGVVAEEVFYRALADHLHVSYLEDALDVARWNRLHPGAEPRVPYVTDCLASGAGPVVGVSDWMVAVADQISRWVPRRFDALGTDGFGFSDTRPALRRHFEVDAAHIVVAVLAELARAGAVPPSLVMEAIAGFGIDADTEAIDRAAVGAHAEREAEHARQHRLEHSDSRDGTADELADLDR